MSDIVWTLPPGSTVWQQIGHLNGPLVMRDDELQRFVDGLVWSVPRKQTVTLTIPHRNGLAPYLKAVDEAVRNMARSTGTPLWLFGLSPKPVPNGREYSRRQRARKRR